jgi:HKD family nuclease
MLRFKSRRNAAARIFERNNRKASSRLSFAAHGEIEYDASRRRIKEEIKDCAEVDLLVDFIETSKRGVVK